MSAFALPRSLCILQSWLYIPHMLSGSSPSAAKHLLLHKRCEFVRMLMFISITFICLVWDSSHISAYSKVMRSAVLLPDSTYFWLKFDFALGHTDGWEIKGEKKPWPLQLRDPVALLQCGWHATCPPVGEDGPAPKHQIREHLFPQEEFQGNGGSLPRSTDSAPTP